MKRYIVRRNPGTGRWIMYARTQTRLHWPDPWRRTATETPVYQIIGNCDTMQHAIEGVYS